MEVLAILLMWISCGFMVCYCWLSYYHKNKPLEWQYLIKAIGFAVLSIIFAYLGFRGGV